jgi:Reverse transcriptase (RNA-dependent DNA polymerase)
MEVYLACERNRQKRVIVLMDFEKVYDRVDRGWMEKCMRKVSLLNRYIWCMETVVNAKSVIEKEEVLEPFKIERGVRQDCPLAPLLFVLLVEVLGEAIRKNKKFKGLVTEGVQ